MRDIEELRAIAVSMGKTLDKLLYDMLSDAMKENERIRTELNSYKVKFEKVCMLLEEYKYTKVDEYAKVIEFYKKIKKALQGGDE